MEMFLNLPWWGGGPEQTFAQYTLLIKSLQSFISTGIHLPACDHLHKKTTSGFQMSLSAICFNKIEQSWWEKARFFTIHHWWYGWWIYFQSRGLGLRHWCLVKSFLGMEPLRTIMTDSSCKTFHFISRIREKKKKAVEGETAEPWSLAVYI